MRNALKTGVLALLVALLTGCASFGSGTNVFVNPTPMSAHLTIRNVTECDLVADVDYQGESLVIKSGEKKTFSHNPGFVSGSNHANVSASITSLRKQEGCDLRSATSRWSVNTNRESNELWVVESRNGRLIIQR